jgi:hypothetical protein
MNETADINFHQKAYVCIHVFDGVKPVLLVDRTDGSWCFLCGDGHVDNASMYRVVGIGHILDRDPSLIPLLNLLPNWEAERRVIEEPWIRKPSSD